MFRCFETACRERGVALWVLPPRKPQWNGYVERANRTGREEFWECYDGELDVPSITAALQAWESEYNTVRLHHSLGDAQPLPSSSPTACPLRPELTGLMRAEKRGSSCEDMGA